MKSEKENKLEMLGSIIDMPIDKFKEEIVKQEVNIGIINNLILSLTSSYHELKRRKEAVLDLVFKGDKNKEEITPVLKSIYAELIKLEEKITYLKEKSKELLDLKGTS